jgi:hypothetical protein
MLLQFGRLCSSFMNKLNRFITRKEKKEQKKASEMEVENQFSKQKFPFE